MLFTSFVKGIFDDKKAKDLYKIKKEEAKAKGLPPPYFFKVDMYKTERDDKLDFGFIRGDGQPYDIVLNIYNVLRI